MAVELGTAYINILPSTSGLAPALTKAFRSVSGAGNAAGSAVSKGFTSRLTSGLATTAKMGGAVIGTTAVLGAAAFAKNAVSLEAEFSKTMNVLAAVTEAPKAELDKLSDLAMDMGRDTVFSAKDAADAMLELAKNGMSPATIQAGALKEALTLAAAGGVSMTDAATIMGNTLNAFNLKGGEAGQVAAALAGAANASSADIGDLSAGLAQASTVAADAGLSVQETTGAIAAFANAGISGSDAGTSLKTMLTRLVPSTAAAAAKMKEIGFSAVDANGNFKSFGDIAGNLQKSIKGMSDEERSATLNTIFGSDARRAATIIAKEGTAGLAKYVKQTSDAGAADRAAAAQMKGTAGAIEQMKGSMETAGLAFGMALKPVTAFAAGVVTKIANGAVPIIQDLPGKLKPLFAKVKEFAGIFQRDVLPKIKSFATYVRDHVIPYIIDFAKDIAKWLMPKLKWLGGFIKDTVAPALFDLGKAVMKVVGFFREHSKVAAALAIAIGLVYAIVQLHTAYLAVQAVGGLAKYLLQTKLVSAATRTWAAVQWVINAAMTANPIGLVIIAIVALIAVAILVWKNFDKVKAVLSAVFGFLKSAVTKVIDFVKDHWKLLLAILMGPFGLALFLIHKFWGNITAAIGAAWGFIKGIFGKLIGGIVDGVGGAFGKLAGFATTAWDTIKDGIKAIPGFIVGLGGKFLDAGKALIGKLGKGLGAVGGMIADVGKGVVNFVIGQINKIIDSINGALEFSVFGKDINIADIPTIPELATGGRVTKATLAVIGEGKEPETVLPDSVLRGMLDRAGGGKGTTHDNRVFIDTLTVQDAAEFQRRRQGMQRRAALTGQGVA